MANKHISGRKTMLCSRRRIRGVILLVFIIGVQLSYSREENKSSWLDSISVNGFLSVAYVNNFNNPDTMKNLFHVFDFDDRTMKIDVMELSIKKDVPTINDVGFRVDMTAGSSIPRIARSAGFNIGDFDFHQMYLSYNAPLGKGIRFDVGKFITSLGYEVIEGYDGYNDNYSRSFLFGYAIPFTHTGIKASYSFDEHVSALLMLVNGWDNAVDSNTSKSVCVQVGLAPVSGMNLIANVMTGPEKPNNNVDTRNLFDFVGTYAVTSDVTIGVNVDYGTEEHSAANDGTAKWFGSALYLRYNLLENFSLSLRGETFEDRDGFRTGVPQILREVTITPEYRASDHLVIRGDIRLDKSDHDVFPKNNTLTDGQGIAAINVILHF